MRYACDLHLHSCLSPCADDEMTPCNIVNMAALCGLDVIAVTDHNSCGNCAAVVAAAARLHPRLVVLSGMELTTAEEAHVVCLFADPASAERFGQFVCERLAPVENRPALYGNQLYADAEDRVTGVEERLLIGATSLSVFDVVKTVAGFGGAAFPAHVDRPAYSVLSNLGFITPEMGFKTVEFSKNFRRNDTDFLEKHRLVRYNGLMDSDAHTLGDIGIAEDGLELADCTAAAVLARIGGN